MGMRLRVSGIRYRVPDKGLSEGWDSCFRRNDTVGEPSSQQLIPDTRYPIPHTPHL